jgi:hypothetical protein
MWLPCIDKQIVVFVNPAIKHTRHCILLSQTSPKQKLWNHMEAKRIVPEASSFEIQKNDET